MDNPIKMDDLGVPLYLETPMLTTQELVFGDPVHVVGNPTSSQGTT